MRQLLDQQYESIFRHELEESKCRKARAIVANLRKILDKQYYDSGRWKCDQSITGAHHWIICYDTQECKYCHETRKVTVFSRGYNYYTREEIKKAFEINDNNKNS